MTDRDNITLPREVVELALEVVELALGVVELSSGGEPMGTMEREAIAALRTALAAEQPKPSEDSEALRRDAERYRYLRDKAYVWDSDMPKAMRPVALWLHAGGNANIDAAIDAAMKRGDKT